MSSHLKNRQNFKGIIANEYSIDDITLKQRIEAMPEDRRHAFKIPHGIMPHLKKSKFGAILPFIDKVVQVPMNYKMSYYSPNNQRY